MPRITQDTLLGYQFAIVEGTRVFTDDAGNVVHDGHGAPRLVPEKALVFTDPASGHVVVCPLSDESRQELVRQLTGGIVVANGGRVL